MRREQEKATLFLVPRASRLSPISERNISMLLRRVVVLFVFQHFE
jgi:hypothetical protein